MMNELHLQMMRLLDGEMNAAERRLFLRELDQNYPEGWRDLALGFIENQIVTEALRAQGQFQGGEVVLGKKTSFWSPAWLGATAAALLLGLLVGAISMKPGSSPDSGQPMAGTQNDQEQPLAPTPVNTRLAYLAGGVPPLEELNSALQDKGYKPKMTRGYVEARLPDGRMVIVPISQMALETGD